MGVGRAVCTTLGKDLGERRVCLAVKVGSAELGLSGEENRLTP